MSLDTYANLQTSIGNFLNRADLTAVIPDFIALAEAQILRRLMMAWKQGHMLPRKMVTRNAAFSISTEMVTLPTDFLGLLSLSIDLTPVKLRYVKPETLAHEKARRGAVIATDTPAIFSVVGTQFQFLPAPDATYVGTLVYWQKFTALVTADTNWILQDHPDVYLYGALTQSAPYLIDDNRMATWGTLFTQAIDDLIKSDPLPNDGSLLRADLGITFRPYSMTNFDITQGDFV